MIDPELIDCLIEKTAKARNLSNVDLLNALFIQSLTLPIPIDGEFRVMYGVLVERFVELCGDIDYASLGSDRLVEDGFPDIIE